MNTTRKIDHDPVVPRRRPSHAARPAFRNVSAPVLCGLGVGILLAASPLAFWWLPRATVYALGLILIASVYIGFSVADGRWKVIAGETGVAAAFIVTAAIAVTGPAWLLVAGLTGHGLKDLWQHRTHYVANTRWWPPFCAAIDWVAAALLAAATAAGTQFL